MMGFNSFANLCKSAFSCCPANFNWIRRSKNSETANCGFVAMPNVWLFQIFFQLNTPLVHLTMIWSFISFVIVRLEHPNEFDPTKLEKYSSTIFCF
jgi:hypothetical protein